MSRPNISIILMDTMRLDEFTRIEKKYGDLTALGFSFLNNCISPSSWTLPSHASLFTGLYPSKHGAHETTKIKSLDIEAIRLKMPTFVKELSNLGYESYAISANPYVHPVYGFRDFDFFKEESYFTDIFGSVVEISENLKSRVAKYRNEQGDSLLKLSSTMLMDDPNLFFEALGSAAVHTPQAAVKKLRAKLIDGWPIEKGGKNTVKNLRNIDFAHQYFLFVNLMEAHDPYIGKKGRDFNWATPFKKEKPNEELIALWKGLYSKASIRAYRYSVQIVKDMIDRYGDEQIFIITSDHGQAFNEHGFVGHGTVLYDEVVKIPMAIKMPHGQKYSKAGVKGSSSLVNVKSFLFEAIKSNPKAFEKFNNKAVYAESFGIPANITMAAGIDMAKIRAHEKRERRRF